MTDVSEHMVTADALAHVVANLRQRDREEIFALRWNDSEAELLTQLRAVVGQLWRVWCYRDEPVAVCGVLPIRPGVVSCASFGTDKWRHALRPMTVWVHQWLIPVLLDAGYHRGEAHVSATNEMAKRWIEAVGAHKEAYLHQYGRNREDFILYAWRSSDVLQIRRWRGRRTADANLSNVEWAADGR